MGAGGVHGAAREAGTAPEAPFWERKTLSEMTPEEWESLCDGCGRCCLVKLEDPDDGRVVTTAVSCRLLDVRTARCSDYGRRKTLVPECIVLRPSDLDWLDELPSTCAYRRLARGQSLPEWHPLVTGRAESVREAGISVAGRVIAESIVHPDDLERHIVDWFD